MPPFGSSGGERFPDPKVVGPGPGQYDPKLPAGYKADPKSGFLTGERFGSEDESEPGERVEMSPPRQRKLFSGTGEKKFSAATVEIHRLMKELEAVQAKLKEESRAGAELHQKLERSSAAHTAIKSDNTELKSKLGEVESLAALLQKEHTEATAALSDATRKGEQLIETNASLEVSVAEATQRLAQVQSELAQLQQQKMALESEILDVSQERDELMIQLESVSSSKATLEHELQSSSADLASLRSHATQESETNARLNAELEAALARIEEVTARLADIEARLAERSQEVERLTSELEEARRESLVAAEQLQANATTIEAQQAELATLKQDLGRSLAEIEDLRSKISVKDESLQAIRGEMTNQMAVSMSLKIELERAQGGLRQLGSELQDKDTALGEFQEMVENQESIILEKEQAACQLVAQVEELQGVRDGMEMAKQELEAGLVSERQQVAAHVSKISELEKAVQQLSDSLAAETQLLEQHMCKIAQLEASLDESQKHAADLDASLSNTITGLKSELGASNASVEQMKVQLSHFDAELATRTAELASSQGNLEKVSAELATSTEAGLALTAEASQLSEDLKARDSQIAELAGRLALQKESGSKQAADMVVLQATLQASQANAEQLRDQLSNKTSDLEARGKDLAERDNTLAQLELEGRKMREEAAAISRSAVAELENLHGRLVEREAELETLNAELSAKNDEVAALSADLSAKNDEVAALDADLGAKNDEVAALSADLADKCDVVLRQEGEMAQMKDKVVKLEAVLSEGGGTIGQLRQADEEARQVILKLQSDISAGKEAEAQLQASLADRVARITALEDEAVVQREAEQQLQAKVAVLKDEVSVQKEAEKQLQAKVATMEDEISAQQEAEKQLQAKFATMEDEISAQQEAEKQLQNKVAYHAARINALETEGAALQATASSKESLVQKLEASIAELSASLEQRNAELDKQSSAMVAAQEAATQLSASLEQRDAELDQQSSAMAAVQEGLNATVTEKDAAINKLQAEINEKTASLAELSASLAEVQSEVGSVSKERAQEAESYQASISQMATALSQGESIIADLRSELATQQGMLEEGAKKVEEAELATQQQKDVLTLLVSSVQESETLLQNKLETAKQEAAMQASLAAESAQVADKKLAESSSLISRLQEEQELMKEMFHNVEVELQASKSSFALVNEEHSAAREEICELHESLDMMRVELSGSEIRCAALESMAKEAAEANRRLAECEARAAEMEHIIVELKDRMASATPILANAKLDKQVHALSETLAVAEERYQAAEREAARQKRAAQQAGAVAFEVERLTAENCLLSNQLQTMQTDLRDYMDTNSAALGHNNPRQKIQYHLRLKQELEEMRHECTVLLREQFLLEQCVRYLATRAHLAPLPDRTLSCMGTGEQRQCVELVVPPSSLVKSPMFSTPIGQKTMKLGARARGSEVGTVYNGRENFVNAIEEACRKTLDELSPLRDPASSNSSTPVRKQRQDDASMHDQTPPRGRPDQNLMMTPVGSGGMGSPVEIVRSPAPLPGGAGDSQGLLGSQLQSTTGAALEARILDKVQAICTPSSSVHKSHSATGGNPSGPAGGKLEGKAAGGNPLSQTAVKGKGHGAATASTQPGRDANERDQAVGLKVDEHKAPPNGPPPLAKRSGVRVTAGSSGGGLPLGGSIAPQTANQISSRRSSVFRP